MNKERLFYTVAGAAVAATSAALIVGYHVCKAKQKAACAGLLVAGIAGMVVGAALAYKPEADARKRLAVEDLFEDDDVELVNRNISEVLGGSADHGEPNRAPMRQIELDEEATIEDFIVVPQA